jgi:hypothetical protein
VTGQIMPIRRRLLTLSRPSLAGKERQEHAAPASSTTTRPLKGGQVEPFTGHGAMDHDESPRGHAARYAHTS